MPDRADRARRSAADASSLPLAHAPPVRMQNAGWSADVERWESDEDSDGSDEEHEKDLEGGFWLSEAAVLRLMA